MIQILASPETLKAEIDNVIAYDKFWDRNVLFLGKGAGKSDKASDDKSKNPKGGKPGKAKSDKGKGKGKKGGKGKNNWWQQPAATPAAVAPQGSPPPQGAPQAPAGGGSFQWAPSHPHNKKEFCKKYHAFNNCAGGCSRSHACPVIKKDGTPCLVNHRAADHV